MDSTVVAVAGIAAVPPTIIAILNFVQNMKLRSELQTVHSVVNSHAADLLKLHVAEVAVLDQTIAVQQARLDK